MTFFLKIVCVFLLVFPQTASAEAPSREFFREKHLETLNASKTSHDFAKLILSRKPSELSLQKVSQKLLNDKIFEMPVFKVVSGSLHFKLNTTNYKLSHVRDAVFTLNGKTLDLQSQDWRSQFSYRPSSYLVPTAHALAPVLYYVLYGVVFIVGSGCIAMSLGSQRSSTGISAKWIHVNRFNFNSAVQEIRNGLKAMGCAANADSAVDPLFDYAHFFENYCDRIRYILASSDEDIRAIRPWYGSLTFEEQRERYINQNARTLGVGHVRPDILNQMTLRSCTNNQCTSSSGSMPYELLPEIDRSLVEQFIENEQFVRECVNESLARVSPPANETEGSGTSAQ